MRAMRRRWWNARGQLPRRPGRRLVGVALVALCLLALAAACSSGGSAPADAGTPGVDRPGGDAPVDGAPVDGAPVDGAPGDGSDGAPDAGAPPSGPPASIPPMIDPPAPDLPVADPPGADPPPEGAIDVPEALRSPPGTAVAVRGGLFIEPGPVDRPVARLCWAILESYPPQCGGPGLTLLGLDPGAVPGLERDGLRAWTMGEVVVHGTRSGADALVVTAVGP